MAVAMARNRGAAANTSRGGLVDEAALLDALDRGILAGAAVDVLTGEDRLLRREDHPVVAAVRARHDLLVTPHIGGASRDSMRATEVFIAGKLRDALKQLAVGIRIVT